MNMRETQKVICWVRASGSTRRVRVSASSSTRRVRVSASSTHSLMRLANTLIEIVTNRIKQELVDNGISLNENPDGKKTKNFDPKSKNLGPKSEKINAESTKNRPKLTLKKPFLENGPPKTLTKMKFALEIHPQHPRSHPTRHEKTGRIMRKSARDQTQKTHVEIPDLAHAARVGDESVPSRVDSCAGGPFSCKDVGVNMMAVQFKTPPPKVRMQSKTTITFVLKEASPHVILSDSEESLTTRNWGKPR